MYAQLEDLRKELYADELSETEREVKQNELKEKIQRLIKEAEDLSKRDTITGQLKEEVPEDDNRFSEVEDGYLARESLIEQLDEALNSRESALSLGDFDLKDDERASLRQTFEQLDITQLDEIKNMYSQLETLKVQVDENVQLEVEKQAKQDELKDKITRLIREADDIVAG